MIRVILFHALLFAIPFAAYGLWLFIQKKEQTSENWREGPIVYMASAGTLLAAGGLVFFAETDMNNGSTVYIPAKIIDGDFIPGRYEQR